MTLIGTCIKLVEEKIKQFDAGDDHGMNHIKRVAENTGLGLCQSEWSNKLSESDANSMILAAYLHEVDDRKLTKTSDYENAREILSILNEKYPDKFDPALVIKIIDLVSCSKNGNNVPEGTPVWMLFVRAADRMEAIGKIGAKRCVEYSKRVGDPLYTPETPLSLDHEEILSFATPERFNRYVYEGGKSVSIIDHFYDKLLHLNRVNLPEIQASEYFLEHAKNAQKETLDELVKLINIAVFDK